MLLPTPDEKPSNCVIAPVPVVTHNLAMFVLSESAKNNLLLQTVKLRGAELPPDVVLISFTNRMFCAYNPSAKKLNKSKEMNIHFFLKIYL